MTTHHSFASRTLASPARTSVPVSAAVADRLYRVAARLEWDGHGSRLADDFASSMIIAVVRFLTKTGADRADGTRRTIAEQADFAEALLRRFWAMNARRNAARRTQAQDRGTAPVCVSWEEVLEETKIFFLHDPRGDDLLAGETGRAVARFLEDLGWPRERAWAFVWRESGREWDDVAFLLSERFEADASPARLRKWGERYFEPIKPQVQAFLKDCDLAAPRTPCAVGSPKPVKMDVID